MPRTTLPISANTCNTAVAGKHNSPRHERHRSDFEDLSFLERLPSRAAVCDIYSPAQTALLSAQTPQPENDERPWNADLAGIFSFEKWFRIPAGSNGLRCGGTGLTRLLGQK